MIYDCCDTLRRDLVVANNARAGATLLNGIDYLEVLDKDAPANTLPQQTLMVHLLLGAAGLTADNVQIEGGARIQNIGVDWVVPANAAPSAYAVLVANLPDPANILFVGTDSNGDHSTYTLRLVTSVANADANPPTGFDPQLCQVPFSFKAECASLFDCKPSSACPPETPAAPDINYLAKDYAGFRTLVLDRLTQLVPGWAGTNEADLGVALAELVAYAADHLSYKQDAVATEAFLNTARRRISLRRHALLMDYHVHDGCNARAWLQVTVQAGAGPVPLGAKGTRFYTRIPGLPSVFSAGSREAQLAELAGAQVFEPMADATLYQEHEQMPFYTWRNTRCCLPVGATSATLQGHYPNLAAGDVLVFEEVMGPLTGEPTDADLSHRCVVRLTLVVAADAVGNPRVDPLPNPDGSLTQITEIQWSQDDALPFPLCISSVTDAAHLALPLPSVSVAMGSIVLVDNGERITGEDLGFVPVTSTPTATDPSADRCNPPSASPVAPPYRPSLQHRPVTQAAPLATTTDAATQTTAIGPGQSAASLMTWLMDDVKPWIKLQEVLDSTRFAWAPQRDLLDSAFDALDFVAEAESGGAVTLRFGDDVNGKRPTAGAAFTADYRVGNGIKGNVGAESIRHVLSPDARVTGVVNPLPAAGGVDAETSDQIRRRAPQAYRTQDRAVTAGDYQDKANLVPDVQRTAASFRWTGSWHTVFVAVDPLGGGAPSSDLKAAVAAQLESYRMAGYDVEIDEPTLVSLDIEALICVDPDYFRSDVELALTQVLGSKKLPDGRLGLFYPDNLTFGQTVYLSPIYAAARGVEGVSSVQVTRFQRQGVDDVRFLLEGRMPLGSTEVPRLDNDPNAPENGTLTLVMCGGK